MNDKGRGLKGNGKWCQINSIAVLIFTEDANIQGSATFWGCYVAYMCVCAYAWRERASFSGLGIPTDLR